MERIKEFAKSDLGAWVPLIIAVIVFVCNLNEGIFELISNTISALCLSTIVISYLNY